MYSGIQTTLKDMDMGWQFTKERMVSTKAYCRSGDLWDRTNFTRASSHRFWYSMLQCMTGPRRHASGILTIPKSDYGNTKIMRFLSPYAGGNDNLIVDETPAEDVHVEDAELGAFLDEIY